MTKRVLMIIAPENFRDEEYFQPKEVFEDAGIDVTTASENVGAVRGKLGGTATADITLTDVNPDEYDAVVFVGGNGAQHYFNHSKAHEIAQKASSSGKIVAAICIAPMILANAGVLQGKRATVWGDDLPNSLKEKGIKYTGEPVTKDGKIITANGPEAAHDFAVSVLKTIKEGE